MAPLTQVAHPSRPAADSVPRSSRVIGVDVARGVALFGMLATHVVAIVNEQGGTATVIAAGRSAATFVLIAGVGLAFISGGRHVVQGAERTAAAGGLVVRALLIGAIGLALGALAPFNNVEGILTFYALLFLLAIPLIGLPPRVLAGVAAGSSRERAVPSPTEVTSYPDAVARALALLRDAGVAGRYALFLGEEEWVRVTASTEHGLPVTEHLRRLLDGDVLPARALESPLVLSARGGDFALHLVEDVSVGFLSNTDTTVRLYVEEAFTFLDHTAEAAVPFVP